MLDSLCTHLRVRHWLFTTYYPQTNGLVEWFNKTLCKILARYSVEYKKDWDRFLPSALFAYRIIRQNTIQYEPFYLTYGRDAVLPIDLEMPEYPFEERSVKGFEDLYFSRLGQLVGWLVDDRQQAHRNIEVAQDKQKKRHDGKIWKYNYVIGKKVLLKNFRAKKLDQK